MCGIVGLWQRRRGVADGVSSVRAGMGRLRHRGPDDDGMFSGDEGALTLGHRRLAVIDTSSAGHQPMASEDGRFVVTYNGEIYNYRELRQELAGLGHTFTSESDTEVLLQGYAEWGEAVLDRLVGMFAFALWDTSRRRLFLARDRAGEKPLYYADTPALFAFASELQALAAVPSIDRSIDLDAVALFLEHQYVPAPHSIFAGVRKLPPGHALVVGGEGMRLWRYWNPLKAACEPPSTVTEGEALEQLEALLTRAVRQQMIADVPLGAFLSGGIDSSAVVAVMREVASGPVRTFTIGFEDPRFDEAPHAARVAELLGTEHTCEVLTERDALELVPTLPDLYGEPFADPSALPTRLVAEVARRHVTVSLSGDGGDELFGGYTRYHSFQRAASLGRLAGPLPRLAARPLSRFGGRVGAVSEALLAGRPSDPYHPFVGVFRAPEVERLTGRRQPLSENYELAWTATRRFPPVRRAMVTDLLTYLPDAVLAKVDRAAMASSLETRAPLLDHRLMEWALRLPGPLVEGKHLLKAFAYRRLPREVMERPKTGFGVPLASWLRTDLADMLHDLLQPSRLEPFGIGNARFVQDLVRDHLSGRRDRSTRLWALMMLGQWGSRQSSG